jgi:hypothetical protein
MALLPNSPSCRILARQLPVRVPDIGRKSLAEVRLLV